MCPEGMLLCPRLKGHTGGAWCEAAGDFVRNIRDASIKICMGRHYEACFIYQHSLNVQQSDPVDPPSANHDRNENVTAA